MKRLAFLLLATLAVPGLGQSVKLPAEVKGDPGTIVVVKAQTDCTGLRWLPLDPGLSQIPPDLLKDSRTAVVMAGKPGRYRLLAYGALKDAASEPAVCTVVIGEAPPGPGPGPGPGPQPGGVFNRALILFESAERSKMPRAQDAILTDASVHAYLTANTLKDKENPNGAWRVWDKDVSPVSAGKPWADLMARPRTGVPWLILSNDAGVVYEGVLPADVPATLSLLAKYQPTKKKAG